MDATNEPAYASINAAYAGIGSRRTPDKILYKMTEIATDLQEVFILRSGGADGADKAFETGVINGNKEIFLHKKGAFGNDSPLYNVTTKALELAEYVHPKWHLLGYVARQLMARNGYQVLGKNLDDPSKFILCYTPDGIEDGKDRTKDSGGTAQAIDIASRIGIPVINMRNKLWEFKLDDIISNYGLRYEKY